MIGWDMAKGLKPMNSGGFKQGFFDLHPVGLKKTPGCFCL
jgi:hypothetical protein